jgi:hypothetical protein
MTTNSLLTIDQITNEAVRLFTQTNAFLRTVSRQYDDQFARSGAKIGSTLRVRLPNDYTVSTGAAITPQGTNEQNTTLTVATQANVPISFGTAEKTMQMDDFSERVLAPAVNRLAAYVASDLMNVVNTSSNLVSNLSGTTINSPQAAQWLQAGAALDQNLCPRMDRKIILDPVTQSRTISSLAGLFNPQVKIADQYETGIISRDTLGFDWMYDQTTLVHTTGTFSAGGTVNGASQTGSTLTVNAITGTFTKGDIITIAGVYAINRLTGASQGQLRQFVVTSNVTTGATSIPIYPSIVVAPAAFNTVSASPANSAVVSLVMPAGSQYRQNLAYFPEAFTLATADLEMPTSGVVQAARANFDGISLRMIEAYDVMSDSLITRMDILYGYAAIKPEWACVVADVV